MRTRIGAGLALSLLFLQPAASETMISTLAHFGFAGIWAVDCSKPAAPDNVVRSVETTTAGEVRFTENFGDDYKPNIYKIVDARVTRKDAIVLRVALEDGVQQMLSMVKTNGRLRTMRNARLDGTTVVNRGIVRSTGQPTPPLSHCQ